MRNDKPWFVAKDVCGILGTRTDTVRQIAGSKRVATINPNLVGDNGRGHGKDILIINESGLYSLVMKSEKQKYVDYLQGRLSRWGRPRRNDPRYYAGCEEIDLF